MVANEINSKQTEFCIFCFSKFLASEQIYLEFNLGKLEKDIQTNKKKDKERDRERDKKGERKEVGERS